MANKQDLIAKVAEATELTKKDSCLLYTASWYRRQTTSWQPSTRQYGLEELLSTYQKE